ncbi:MAG: DUF1684 domain-containing protein [Candidatus Microbacterium phytovorans]|uniref:DUF1684 domain-containing protein n=1 Tax=Candidatus Microbacterium phytovorans TaxID=3121374 RepID=A0AAJ5W5X9_9MICO|nr:DUF1684 domain-containing protein [Microbacterium sp.]WEK14835.1 MAG: DUF1684 domain-containing protein [Microbacterium sp.]
MVSTHAIESPRLDELQRSYEQWAQKRRETVTAPQGALALVLTHWSPAGEAPVDEAVAREGHPASALFTRLQRTEIETGLPQEGYRIWRQDSPANQAFEDIERYDYDPAWVLEGRFELVDEDRVVPFEHIKDAGATRTLPVSGDLVFAVDGTEYRLAAFDTVYGGSAKLQLVFGDRTNGAESYGAGRFLFLDHPAGAADLRPGDSIPITVDFNLATVPPCGFSNQMNCPLPPLQNRLPFPLRAGERRVRFADGFSL